MNKFIISILLLFTVVSVQAQPVAKVKDFTMKSKYFNHEREVLIYTPVGSVTIETQTTFLCPYTTRMSRAIEAASIMNKAMAAAPTLSSF